MLKAPKPGDLVHIPQAVDLICYLADTDTDTDQLTIPLSVRTTEAPTVAIVKEIRHRYVEVYCEGEMCSVRPENIYSLDKWSVR
jgi:hypothetical protein